MSALDQASMARLAMNPTPTGIGMMAAGKIIGGMFGGNRPPMPTYTEGKGWRYGNSAVRPEFVGNVANYLRNGMAPRQTVFQQQQGQNLLNQGASPIMNNMRNQQQDANYVQAMRMNKYAVDNGLQNPGFQAQPTGRQPARPKASAMKPPTV